MDYRWAPYVSAADRRRKAERAMTKLEKKGHKVSPVLIEGRTIARTFWGKAWCENLERYSDFSNRLPRGRTYVRNGSVLDLQIGPGQVKAMVSGSRIYTVDVKISPVPQTRWRSLCHDCAGAIDSLIELLQGRFSKGVMERLCRQRAGLFPSPEEIRFSCSCPDWASMCKHVAAVLYGIGARLDEQPELLFGLRRVHEKDLLAHAGADVPLSGKGPAAKKILADDDLSGLFGLELAEEGAGRGKSENGKPKKERSEKKKPGIAAASKKAVRGGRPKTGLRERTAGGSSRKAKRRSASSARAGAAKPGPIGATIPGRIQVGDQA